MKDATAKFDVLIKSAELLRDTQAVGKMDPFAQCLVGDVFSKTAVKDQAGKSPVWDENLPFTLESIPANDIGFVIKDKDMTSDDLVGESKLEPHQNYVFMAEEKNR